MICVLNGAIAILACAVFGKFDTAVQTFAAASGRDSIAFLALLNLSPLYSISLPITESVFFIFNWNTSRQIRL